MAKTYRYLAGFTLLSQVKADGLKTIPVAASISIAKGDVLHKANGYGTNATTAFEHGLLGVAVAAVDNSAGGAGAKSIQYIPYLDGYRFIVAVEQNALITQAAVGTLVDLQSVNTIDINDAVVAAPGFFIEEIDVSADAIAVNARGYAIGHFEVGAPA